MEIKVGDFVRWKGEKLDEECEVDGITMWAEKLLFTDGKQRRVISVGQLGGDSIRLRLEGIGNCVLVYPLSMLEVVSQEPELPEYGEKILVWDDEDDEKINRIFVAYDKKDSYHVIVVDPYDEECFTEGTSFRVIKWKHFKRITCEGKPVGVEL